jgi:protein subunit release factor A
LAKEEIKLVDEQIKISEKELLDLLLNSSDSNDLNSIIMEIRPGTGGEEVNILF